MHLKISGLTVNRTFPNTYGWKNSSYGSSETTINETNNYSFIYGIKSYKLLSPCTVLFKQCALLGLIKDQIIFRKPNLVKSLLKLNAELQCHCHYRNLFQNGSSEVKRVGVSDLALF